MKCGAVATVKVFKEGLTGLLCTDCAIQIQEKDKGVHLSWLSA